jgi:hypothetical protein
VLHKFSRVKQSKTSDSINSVKPYTVKILYLTCVKRACCCAVETDGATLMVPARADASVDATLTCGLPAESIVTLGTDVRTPGEAVTTCKKQ